MAFLGLLTVSLLGLGCPPVPRAAHLDDASTDGGPRRRRRSPSRWCPDTQAEVVASATTRLPHRTDWLVDRRDELDLRFVAQVGDLTNWGWLVVQPAGNVASQAMKPLEDAGIPYSVSVGNHDTRAARLGRSRRLRRRTLTSTTPSASSVSRTAECRTPLLVRHTEEINGVLRRRHASVRSTGSSSPGKIDNIYLDLLRRRPALDGARPRAATPGPSVVEWARPRRRAPPHPQRHRQHPLLPRRGKNPIRRTPRSTASTSPRAMWQDLVSRHPNIKIVVSGHVGPRRRAVDRGRAGNKIVGPPRLLPLRATTNPVRLLRINADANVLRTRIVAPATDETVAAGTAGPLRRHGLGPLTPAHHDRTAPPRPL